ncbi:TetR/AcrR family transcriptional regulator [Rhodococcus sp. D2-41]|uniref:TetR/AcrR family transcriptional regulator n=1 Tax=Speluncibacter jeojiensis TaxID=2710754 RepID=UPI0024102CCA|nr:TetR/AcrR family transcriptional regulator [Rhodococcus sp. D2-41]MDG3012922.1 TetR/AcrR family transcriptional regulator [Rhodococcus sp. D2-41]
MARRGDALHEHILDTAKHVFLETGYDRTSMDTIAARAATSKRSLYAHFPTKEALFVGSVERSQELFADRLGAPSEYAADPWEAVARFCGRVRQMLSYAPVIQMCRLGIAEAVRLPQAAAQIHDSFLLAAERPLARHLSDECGYATTEAATTAEGLLGVTVYPFLVGALFGLEKLCDTVPAAEDLDTDIDLTQIQQAVALHARTTPSS